MITGSLARRYARAMMQIGVEENSLEKLGKDVGSMAEAMELSTELTETLSNPAFRRAERKGVLEALLTRLMVTKVTTNFCFLLLDRDRLGSLPAISRELDRMIDERAGRINAVVTSAVPLTPMQVRQLQASLEKLSGKQVKLSHSHDPELLGGLIARVGDVEYDGSLRSQLNKLRSGSPGASRAA